MMVLARVHARFSHLEEFLRDGDLLRGPDRHRWSRDLPAYEFSTGDPTARVVVRKHRKREEWLVIAWAAGGKDREVSVDVPGLGRVKVEACAVGTVCRAAKQGRRAVLSRLGAHGRGAPGAP